MLKAYVQILNLFDKVVNKKISF